MTNYVKSTNFASKDALATGNPLKIVKGTEIDIEFNDIATAVATKADLNSPTFIGTPAAPTASAGTNTTQVATTAFVKTAVDNYDAALTVSTSRIEDNAVTNAKLAVGAAVANIGFTPANSNATVNLTGDQTVAGTKTFTAGVRFNDGTTQSSAVVAPVSGSSMITGGFWPNQSTTSSSFIICDVAFVILQAGSITTRMRCLRGYNDYGSRSDGIARVFINGTAVGSDLVSPGGGNSFTYLDQNFSVNAGDLIQLGIRVASANGAVMQGGMFLQGSSRRQAGGFAVVFSNNPF